MGVYEVTQGQWQTVMGNNPSYFSRTRPVKAVVKDIPDAELKQFPVEQVSWNDVQEFVEELNRREGTNGGACRRRRNGNTPVGVGPPPGRSARSTSTSRTTSPTISLPNWPITWIPK
jgi:hypothetical protein